MWPITYDRLPSAEGLFEESKRRLTGLGINIDKQQKELREKKYFCEIKVLKHNDYKWMNRCEV